MRHHRHPMGHRHGRHAPAFLHGHGSDRAEGLRAFRHRGGGGDWDGPGGRPGGRRRRMFDANELRLVLLKLLADKPRHGYDLIKAIEEMSGGAYAPSAGVVYPTLTLLQEMGQIDEAEAGGARRAYTANDEGRRALDAAKAEVEALVRRITDLAETRERTDAGPLRRAMQNLRSVLIDRFARGEASLDKIHQAVAIIDDAAQRIERL